MRYINHLSDFQVIINIKDKEGNITPPPSVPWEAVFADESGIEFKCYFDGNNYTHCIVDVNDIVCFIDNPGFSCGKLRCTFNQRVPSEDYSDGVMDLSQPLQCDIMLSKRESDDSTPITIEASPNWVRGPKGEQGIQGEKGADGFSPIVSLTKDGSISTISITDAQGEHTTEIADGAKGDDGFSPVVSLSKVDKVTTLTITDAQGTHTATVNDGESVEVVQSTGASTTSVMSQKAVSEISYKVDELESNETIIPADEITSIYPNDLDFSDANNNIIVEFRNGHIRTKNFDSSKDATLLKRGLMSVADKEKLENINTKLTTIEDGAEVNDTEVINASGNEDLNISDEEGNMIALFKDGHIRTKNFDSKDAGQKLHELEPFSHKDAKEADFDVVDDYGNVIFSIIQGWLKTKNFSGKHVYDVLNNIGIQEWCEQWSRMPKTENDNPLAKIRFDGGMCRIFRKWGFIGDSLCSGTINGYVVSLLEYTPITNKAISNGAIVDDSTSVVSDNVTLVGRYPSIKLIFESNSELSGKVLLASYSNGTYTPLITGSNAKEYSNINIPNNSVIAISYPNNNIPRVLLSVDGTQLANYEMSWGQQLVRLLGAEGYNFSVGGEYAKRWCQGSGGTGSRNWDKAQQTDYLKDAYIIGLGVNDASYWMSGQTTIVDYPCVTAYPNQSDYVDGLVLTDNDIMNDIDVFDYNNNANSFAGWYAGVIQRIKSVRKDAYIFCCTLPAASFNSPYSQVIRKIVEKLNTHYKEGTIWLLDLSRFNPITTEMAQNIKNDSHLTAFGYLYSAYQFASYIDWIIRHNIQKFKDVPFIGTNIVSEIFDESKINE